MDSNDQKILKMEDIEFMQKKNTFSMTCRVEAKIHTKADVIWALLTDAKGFSRWNSTITSIDGIIRAGERIRIHVPGTDRSFKPRVSDVEANRRMTWSNGFAPLFRGCRTFELRSSDDGRTDFVMEEKFDGILFAIIKNRLPDFKLIFKKYAMDLKSEAERLSVHVS